MTEQELLQELCRGCNGCSTKPTSIGELCSNPLEKYLYAKRSVVMAESYFRGRRDGLTMLGANVLSKLGNKVEL